MTFTVGEEVLVDDMRFVVSEIEGHPPVRYRLLATTPTGAVVRWVSPAAMGKIAAYTTASDDTDRAVRYR